VIHWKANRLLPSLLDGILPRDTELKLRCHTASCARCRKKLSDLELSEQLLARLPSSLIPLEYGPGSYARLAALSRWTDDARYADPERWKVPVLGVAGAVAIFLLALSANTWEPSVSLFDSTVTLATQLPDSSYIPSRLR